MKKIGILTLPNKYNYGALLQTYSLCNYFKNLGHEVKVINYQNIRYSALEHLYYLVFETNIFLNFFLKKNTRPKFNSTDRYYHIDKNILDNFDYIVYGSDELWNLGRKSIGLDTIYFGKISSKKHIKVSYSCSFGNTDIKNSKLKIIKKFLKNIKSISVRDNNSKLIIKKLLNKNCQVTVDPVLLNTFNNIKLRNYKLKKKYLLLYLKSNTIYKKKIIDFAKKNNLKIISVAFKCSYADKNFSRINYKFFLSLFKFSSFIISDMYHGLQFSIMYKKKMFLIENEEKKLKIDYLKKKLSLNMISKNTKITLKKINDFNKSSIKNIMLKELKKSKKYLNELIA